MNDYLPTQPGTQVRLDVELPRRTSRALWRHITRHAILRRQPGWGCAYCGLPPSIPASDLLQLAAQPAAARSGTSIDLTPRQIKVYNWWDVYELVDGPAVQCPDCEQRSPDLANPWQLACWVEQHQAECPG